VIISLKLKTFPKPSPSEPKVPHSLCPSSSSPTSVLVSEMWLITSVLLYRRQDHIYKLMPILEADQDEVACQIISNHITLSMMHPHHLIFIWYKFQHSIKWDIFIPLKFIWELHEKYGSHLLWQGK
jgi:hypothetical protein